MDVATTDCPPELADLLDVVGYRKKLTEASIPEAKAAILKHFLFYRCLPAILQFMEGKHFVNVNHKELGACFVIDMNCSI
jgi:hypothetical protein